MMLCDAITHYPFLPYLLKNVGTLAGPSGNATLALADGLVVELIGFEPMTPGLQSRCSAS